MHARLRVADLPGSSPVNRWQAAICGALFNESMFLLLAFAISPHGFWRFMALAAAAGMSSWWIGTTQ